MASIIRRSVMPRATQRLGHGRLDVRPGGRLQLVAETRVGQAGRDERLGEARERVLAFPLIELRQLAVLRRVTLVVATQAIGQRLDEGRALPGSCPGDGLAHGRVDGEHVVAVDGRGRDAIDAGVLGQPLHPGVGGQRGELRVAVVLAHEHDRQSPQAGDVQRLVERAGLAGPVAEEGDAHAFHTLEGRRPRVAERQRQVAGDDPGRGREADVRRGDVHRAALAAAVAGRPSGQLGHEASRISPLGQGMGVGPVPAEHPVARIEPADGTHGAALLADPQVEQSPDPALRVERRGGLLEGADPPHPGEQRPPDVGVDGRRDREVDRLGHAVVSARSAAVAASSTVIVARSMATL
jgi:hypothetical protein